MSVTITKITTTKRGRFALFSEDEFLFSLDGETYIKSGVTEGYTLSQAELRDLQSQSEGRKAKDKAFRYLSLRDYASGELYSKLKLTFDERTAAYAVAEMQRLDMLHDEQFAQHRAAYLAKRGKSRREIEMQLLQKGLDRQDINIAMQELPQNEISACVELIRKSYQAKLAEGQRDKVIAALARRGFNIKDIKKAIELYASDSEEDGEYNL